MVLYSWASCPCRNADELAAVYARPAGHGCVAARSRKQPSQPPFSARVVLMQLTVDEVPQRRHRRHVVAAQLAAGEHDVRPVLVLEDEGRVGGGGVVQGVAGEIISLLVQYSTVVAGSPRGSQRTPRRWSCPAGGPPSGPGDYGPSPASPAGTRRSASVLRRTTARSSSACAGTPAACPTAPRERGQLGAQSRLSQQGWRQQLRPAAPKQRPAPAARRPSPVTEDRN